MEQCSDGAKAQQWQLLPVPGVSGIVQIQSVSSTAQCISGGGGAVSPGMTAFRSCRERKKKTAKLLCCSNALTSMRCGRFQRQLATTTTIRSGREICTFDWVERCFLRWMSLITSCHSTHSRPIKRLSPFVEAGTYMNLDDLPAGHMTLMGCNPQTLGPCVWSEAQQRSVFTLYAMTRSPIMFSGDMPTDDATLKIVTNREVLAIQERSVGNRQLSNVAKCSSSNESYACSEVIWVADCSDDPQHGKYVAFFWTGTGNTTIVLPLGKLGGIFTGGRQSVIARDLWRNEDLPRVTGGSLVADLGSHDVLLLRVSPG